MVDKAKEEKASTSDVHVATEIGFKNIDLKDEQKIEDSSYENELVEYVKCLQTQYAYQFPNDYSKTDKFVKEGQYLGFMAQKTVLRRSKSTIHIIM